MQYFMNNKANITFMCLENIQKQYIMFSLIYKCYEIPLL